ncbi:prenyltransferase [Thalassotalea sp. PLHSN55]|uniref:prenyltransferase n=1 Tax=Thalassotalea sp. PLHSN55 TaxID=3435888 RepID=UPI003F84CE4F
MNIKTLVATMRIPFLLLPVMCVFYGAMTVAGDIDSSLIVLIFLAGILANISVNVLNEHQDFESGLDLKTQKTPFSGGSGGLVSEPSESRNVFFFGVLSLAGLLAVGGYFVYLRGLALIPFGLFGMLIIVSYTRYINKQPWLCLVSPGLGIGVMMVIGTQFVLTGAFTGQGLLLSLIPFLLINNLLLLNQYPDIEADKTVGRYHLPIAYGTSVSNLVYGLMLTTAMALLFVFISREMLPTLSLIALLPMLLGYIALYGAIKYHDRIGEQPHFLALNVMASILTPLLLGISLWW